MISIVVDYYFDTANNNTYFTVPVQNVITENNKQCRFLWSTTVFRKRNTRMHTFKTVQNETQRLIHNMYRMSQYIHKPVALT